MGARCRAYRRDLPKCGGIFDIEAKRQALTSFVRKGNLIALRELALRTTADRVDAALRAYREDHAIVETWAAGERVLVCIGPDPLSERVVRAARGEPPSDVILSKAKDLTSTRS